MAKGMDVLFGGKAGVAHMTVGVNACPPFAPVTWMDEMAGMWVR